MKKTEKVVPKKSVKRQVKSIALSKRKVTRKRAIDDLADEIAPWWKETFVYVRKREVATWKGALVLMFISGLAAALIWSAKTDFNDSSKAAAASTLTFVPATLATTNGATGLTLTPTINTGTNSVSIVSLKMTFDTAKLTLTGINVPGYSISTPFYNSETMGFDPAGDLTTFIANANSSGNINFDLSVNTSHLSVKGTFGIATLTFSAKAAGTAAVGYAVTSGASADGEKDSVVTTRTGATITISAADTTPPTFTKVDDVSATFVNSDTINVTVADTTGVAAGSTFYGFSADNVCNAGDTINTAFTSGTTFTISGDHTDYLCMKATDTATTPNTGYFLVGQLHTDNSAPAGGSFTINSNATYTNSTAATLNITCPTDQWATIQMAFGNTAAPTNWTNCSASQAQALLTGDGSKTVYVRFKDGGSNTTTDITKTITLDTTPPVSSAAAVSVPTPYLHSSVIVVSDGTDATSSINTATRTFQRRSAVIAAGDCATGNYGSWTLATLTGTYPNFTDNNTLPENCYQYQYSVKDNAGNQVVIATVNAAKMSYIADVNLDGKVDYQDYGLFHPKYGKDSVNNPTEYDINEDLNADGSIDYLDYGVLHSLYGKDLSLL